MPPHTTTTTTKPGLKRNQHHNPTTIPSPLPLCPTTSTTGSKHARCILTVTYNARVRFFILVFFFIAFYDDYDSTMPLSWSQPLIFKFMMHHSLPCGKFFLVSFLLMIIFLYYNNSELDYDSTSWLWLMIGAMTTIAPCPHHDHNHPYSWCITHYPVVSFFLFHFF